jgi:hypothetical protein
MTLDDTIEMLRRAACYVDTATDCALANGEDEEEFEGDREFAEELRVAAATLREEGISP